MTELQTIFVTSTLTVLSGTIVYVLGQSINELVIKPYINYKKTIGGIDEELIFYSNIYTSPGSDKKTIEIYLDASKRFRRLASQFGAVYRTINLRNCFIRCQHVIPEKDKDIVEGNLIFLSNALWEKSFIEENLNKSAEIRKILKI